MRSRSVRRGKGRERVREVGADRRGLVFFEKLLF